MRRALISLTVSAAAAVALTGCVVTPPSSVFGFGSYGFSSDTEYEEFDPAAEEQWQEEARQWDLDFTEDVAAELRSAGSSLPPDGGESLEVFRHVVTGVGYEWCDRLVVDDSRRGDATEYAEQAQRYGWSVDDYRIVVEAAEIELCGY
jgi:hypothetical protein